MPRYLTPTKICLLVLVDLYTAGAVPSNVTLELLSFIASQITLPSDDESSSLEEHFKLQACDISAFAAKVRQWPSTVPGRTLYDTALQRLWELNGVDSLYALFEHVNTLVLPQASDAEDIGIHKVSRASPLGQFIRRCYVDWTRLQFNDSKALWNTFSSYRASSYDTWAQRNPDSARRRDADQPAWAGFQTERAQEIDQPSRGYASADDSDSLLSFSIHKLQKMGTRVPHEVKQRLEQWLSDQWESGAQSLQHFMTFFEHWRSGQYTMALDSLHRYFDYSMIARGASDNMKLYYQYALLHQSVLHADFECWEQSVDAMDECIATARENQDTACLNFALSWVLYLRQAHPHDGTVSFENLAKLVGAGSGQQDEIEFVKAKARDSKHWSLMSSTLLEESKMDMYSGVGVNRALEHILQSSYLNVQHNLRNVMPATALFQGASLERMGQTDLSMRTYESIKLIHSTHCPLAERVRAGCRIAHALARKGQFRQAQEVLSLTFQNTGGVLKLQQRVHAFTVMIQFRKNLYHSNLEYASRALEDLQSMPYSGEPDLAFETLLLEVDLRVAKSELETALHLVNANIETLKKNPGSDIAQRIHLLVSKASIFLAGGQAAKAISIILRAASTAERYCLNSVLIEALQILTSVLNELGEFTAAKDLVEAALPHALEYGDLELVSLLFSNIAEAHVGIAGYLCTDVSPDRAMNMRLAQQYVERSLAGYTILDHRRGKASCLTMKSVIAKWQNDAASASQADEMHKRLLSEQRMG